MGKWTCLVSPNKISFPYRCLFTNFSYSISCVVLVNILDLYREDWEEDQLHNVKGLVQNENEGPFVKKRKKKKKVWRISRLQSPSKCCPHVRLHQPWNWPCTKLSGLHQWPPHQASYLGMLGGDENGRGAGTSDSSYCVGLFTPFQPVFIGMLKTKDPWEIYQFSKW